MPEGIGGFVVGAPELSDLVIPPPCLFLQNKHIDSHFTELIIIAPIAFRLIFDIKHALLNTLDTRVNNTMVGLTLKNFYFFSRKKAIRVELTLK